MNEERLTPSEVCAIAGCEYGALAAWRIRLGFLPRTSCAPQQKYTVVDSVRSKVDLDRFGEGLTVAVGREPNGELVAETFMFPNSGSLDFVGDVVIVIRLGSVAWAQ